MIEICKCYLRPFKRLTSCRTCPLWFNRSSLVMGQWLQSQRRPYMARVTQHLLTCGEQVTKIWCTNLHCTDGYSLAEVKRQLECSEEWIVELVRRLLGKASWKRYYVEVLADDKSTWNQHGECWNNQYISYIIYIIILFYIQISCVSMNRQTAIHSFDHIRFKIYITYL